MKTQKHCFITLTLCWVCALLTLTASTRVWADPPPGPSLGAPPPSNPVRQLYIDRRMLIEVASADDSDRAQYGFGRSYGYRIGDIIPIEIRTLHRIRSRASSRFRLTCSRCLPAQATIEKLKEPLFELVQPQPEEGKVASWAVATQSHEQVAFGRGGKQGATVWRLKMLVQTFRAGKSQPFTVQFLCAATCCLTASRRTGRR